MSSTVPNENPDENDFLCLSIANRAALTFGGVGGSGKDGGGLMLNVLSAVGVWGPLTDETDRERRWLELRAPLLAMASAPVAAAVSIPLAPTEGRFSGEPGTSTV